MRMSRGTLQKYLPLAVIFVGALIGGLFVVYAHLEELLPCSFVKTDGIPWEQETAKEKDCSALRADQEQRRQVEAGKQAEIDVLKWPKYRSEDLGVAIRHPETTDGEPFVFFQAGNILFVRTPKSPLYERRAELPTVGDAAVLAKVKQIDATSTNSTDSDRAWEIRVFDATSDADLQKIVDSRFGPDRCLVAGTRLSAQAGVYDVLLKDKIPPPREDDEPDGSCWINWVFHMKYSPSLHRAAMWDIGQDARFPYKGCSDLICSADFPMSNSFRFI